MWALEEDRRQCRAAGLCAGGLLLLLELHRGVETSRAAAGGDESRRSRGNRGCVGMMGLSRECSAGRVRTVTATLYERSPALRDYSCAVCTYTVYR